jgi:hypothetical protein
MSAATVSLSRVLALAFSAHEPLCLLSNFESQDGDKIDIAYYFTQVLIVAAVRQYGQLWQDPI